MIKKNIILLLAFSSIVCAQFTNIDRMFSISREHHLKELAKPHEYRVGKCTKYEPFRERRTILELNEPGILKRLWTTHAKGDNLWIEFFVDDTLKPVISGPAHKLAEAASKISTPSVPLGGFHDQKTVNLYLPLRFENVLKIVAEPIDPSGERPFLDGPYWQIDYKLGKTYEYVPKIIQKDINGEIVFQCIDNEELNTEDDNEELKYYDEIFELSGCEVKNFFIDGPGIIKKIEIFSDNIESLILRTRYDLDSLKGGMRVDPPFQVNAPLKYFVSDFTNTAVERNGNSVSIYFPMPFKKNCAIQLTSAIEYNSFLSKIRNRIKVTYIQNGRNADDNYYFHARYNNGIGNGYDNYEVVSTKGKGHFVGVNIFDNGHDHGGGDNILLDAGTSNPVQLHGICGEDYFHMAYMKIWNRTPYSGSPRHDSRYRYHLEMPIPFEESFVFNWGLFNGQPVHSVAFWYQERPSLEEKSASEFTYLMHGPFALEEFDNISPGSKLPDKIYPYFLKSAEPVKSASWLKTSQQGFVDLCHIHRRHVLQIPPSHGVILANRSAVAETKLWANEEMEVEFAVAADDPIKIFINGESVLDENIHNKPDPLKSFTIKAQLKKGKNDIFIVTSNTLNYNWRWNGFAFKLLTKVNPGEIYCMLPVN